MSLNAGTGQLQVFGYGYDGDVYFSNTGAMDLKDKKITWKINEVTINKTKSEYTVMFSLENPNLLSVQMIDRVVDGKNRRTGSPSCVAKQKTAKSNPSVPPLGQAVSLECAGRAKRRRRFQKPGTENWLNRQISKSGVALRSATAAQMASGLCLR